MANARLQPKAIVLTLTPGETFDLIVALNSYVTEFEAAQTVVDTLAAVREAYGEPVAEKSDEGDLAGAA